MGVACFIYYINGKKKIKMLSLKKGFKPDSEFNISNNTALKIGLFGIGLDTYWPQFEGLKQRLEGYLAIVEERLFSIHPNVLNAGLVDTAEKAFETGKMFRKEDVNIIFLYVTTYALSSTVLPVIQRAKVPVKILNLSPETNIDYAAFNAMKDRTKMAASGWPFVPLVQCQKLRMFSNGRKLIFTR